MRGHRQVAGAGGVVNKEPITHLIPLARSIFPRWNHEDKVLAADPPAGLLDLGARQSKIRGLRRDLQPYCSRISDAEQGMPKKTALSRAGREDLIERIDELGGWYEAAAQLGLASKRKPNGYWENLDFLRDELLQLIYAFWFQEEDEETGETVWYNDISGALTYDTPAVDSGGGLDVPVMPSISDIQEAKRYDLQHAIIFHGGFIEVAEQLGWQMKRYGENRHLLAFSTFADEMHDFIDEMGEDIVPHGRLPTVRMMLDEDREDLVNAARWHGGMWEVGRRMRMKPFAASTLSGLPEAARALREFALESSQSSHPARAAAIRRRPCSCRRTSSSSPPDGTTSAGRITSTAEESSPPPPGSRSAPSGSRTTSARNTCGRELPGFVTPSPFASGATAA